MGSMAEKWESMALRARAGIVAGVVAILVLVTALGVWSYRTEYQVLFADIGPRDAAAMTAALDKLKIPYQLGGDGTTIMVPQDLVYKTRLQLMGTNVPLQGAVGFEVFNNADFGMTEFVQKVNYQRAVQGELTRTILSIEDIQAARVHLAIPEQGLFKKAVTQPKASVTLTMKPGRVLSTQQVAGIQRLVAASVPEVSSADVTVLDQNGVALTRVANGEQPGESSSRELEAKRGTEDYLAKKVTAVLDRTFGAGEAIATVDVALNMDQAKITTEEVLPAKGGSSEGNPTGVAVRERYSVREGEGAALAAGAAGGKSAGTSTSSTESDYQVGRRVEQLAVASGTLKRMTVAVVVRQPLSSAQLDTLKEVVALAVGLNAGRGDAIVVSSMASLVTPAEPVAALAPAAAAIAPAAVPAPGSDPRSTRVVVWLLAALLAAALVAGALLWRRARAPSQPRRLPLSEAARQQMLADVRQWIDTPAETARQGVVK